MPRNTPFFALTTSGLEDISAAELAALPAVTVASSAYRRIEGFCSGPLDPLLRMRTVDDVFVLAARWSGLGRPRSILDHLRHLATQLDLRPALPRAVRNPRFSLTVSFVGKRNYSSAEMKALLAPLIQQSHGWRYEEDDRAADFNVRVFIEGENALVGLRLGKSPLHDRPYRQTHLPGALKPTVAAALCRMVGVGPGSPVLDPCCGSGTLLVEAAMCGAKVYGGDFNPAALAVARTNLAAAGVAAALVQWDAQELPLPSCSVDRVICNLPWGRQVALGAPRAVVYDRIMRELRRVLAPGGRIALLTDAPDDLAPLDLCLEARREISLFGQRPTICLFAKPCW